VITKSELLNSLQEEYSQWEALLDRIGATRMEQPGVNGIWTMKDMVAHLTGWNRWLFARIGAAQRHEPEPRPPWPENLQAEDDINAWIYASNRQRPLCEVLDESQGILHELFTIIERLPDQVRMDKIEPRYYLVWINGEHFEVGEFFDHFHDDHERDVCVWLEQVIK
jgi:hypothetical protein